MEWSLLGDWNTTLPLLWDSVVDTVNEQSSLLGTTSQTSCGYIAS